MFTCARLGNGGLPIPLGARKVLAGVARILEETEHAFRRGRAFGSWLGLTPREYASGGRRHLGGISKRGDRYLRCLLTHGARAVLRSAQRTVRVTPERATARQHWAVTLVARCGYNKAVIAVANTLARTIWAVWAHDVAYQANPRDTAAA